jgi:putative DNA primase/helicase
MADPTPPDSSVETVATPSSENGVHVETAKETAARLRTEASIAKAEATKARAEATKRAAAATAVRASVSTQAAATRKLKLDEQAARKERRAKAKLRLARDGEEAWRERLIVEVTGDGELRTLGVIANVVTILRFHPAWNNVIAYDEFGESVVSTKPPPWDVAAAPPYHADHTEDTWKFVDWTETDLSRTCDWLSRNERLHVPSALVAEAVHVVAETRTIHPVREWIESLRWDGKMRLETWLIDIMGAEDTPYDRAVGKAWAISAIARIYKPGCKVDTVLVLEGKPGTFKSSVLRALVGDEWFFEMSVTDMSNKDAMQILRRKWIAEFPEIDALSKYEQAHVKSYFSRQVDRYRPSFGKAARDFPRQTIFAATTNKSEWIGDETGGTGRRMWPVRCTRGDVALARAYRDNFWAEAKARFECGEEWHITDPELLTAERDEQADRLQQDIWLPTIAAWLEEPIGWDWDEDPSTGKPRKERYPVDLHNGVMTIEVALFALEKPKGQVTTADQMRIGRCLSALGYERGPMRRENGARVRRYVKPSPASPASLPTVDEGGDG